MSLNVSNLSVLEDGTKEWRLNGKRHNENGPAVIWADGYKAWYINGKRHNENGPAIIWSNGDKWWYINGELHNENGPAVIAIDGTKAWYINGELHKKNGPAVIDIDGYKAWFINGKRHNENGPAIISPSYLREPAVLEPATRSSSDGQEPIYSSGCKEWWINDKEYTEEKFLIYKKLKDKYSLLGVPVRNKWRVREIVYSWYDNPKFGCVQKRLERECKELYRKI